MQCSRYSDHAMELQPKGFEAADKRVAVLQKLQACCRVIQVPVLSPLVQRPRSEVVHSPPSSTEVENKWSYTSTEEWLLTTYISLYKYNTNFPKDTKLIAANIHTQSLNPLMPNNPYSGRTAPLTSKHCILYIYSTNTGTDYFKGGIYSPFFSLFKMQFVL